MIALSERTSYSLRLGAFYGAIFLIHGIHLPYLPVWLDLRGLSAHEIAIVTAAPYFLRVLVTPSVALLADRTRQHRAFINALVWLALVLALLLSQMERFWPVLLLAVPFTIVLSTMMPLAETVAVAGVRAYALDYGRMRLWGSVSFVLAGFAGGWLIDRAGADVVIACLVATVAATTLFAWLLPHGERRAATAGPAVPAGPPSERGARDTAAHGAGTGDLKRLVSAPAFLAFLLAAGAAQGAHGCFYAFGALAWQAQGISTAWIGALWAIAIAGEVLLFAYSGQVVRRWGPATMMIAAASAAVLRWTLMSLAPPLPALVGLQVLHTLTYGASHLAAMHFIARAVPERTQGTAQALYATVAMGLLLGGATLVSGWLYTSVQAAAYLAMAALAAVGLGAAFYVRARWSGGLLWDDAPRA